MTPQHAGVDARLIQHGGGLAQRRAKIDETIAAFRGETDRETMVRLAAEVVRLSRNIATLKEGVEQIIAGTEFILKSRLLAG
jgi:hypothetical protein